MPLDSRLTSGGNSKSKRGVPDDVMTGGRVPPRIIVPPAAPKDDTKPGGTTGTPAKPKTPKAPTEIVQKGKDVKVATKELFITEDKTIVEQLATARIFQEIAGIELLSISRSYSIDGITQTYNPISNIADLSSQYSPFNIIPLQGIDRAYFSQYDIDLSRRIPDFPNNPDGSTYNVYVDARSNIVIELADLGVGEKVEIEFLTSEDAIGWYN